MLYKAYVLPNLEYCSPLLLGTNKTLKSAYLSVIIENRTTDWKIRFLLNFTQRTPLVSYFQKYDRKVPAPFVFEKSRNTGIYGFRPYIRLVKTQIFEAFVTITLQFYYT